MQTQLTEGQRQSLSAMVDGATIYFSETLFYIGYVLYKKGEYRYRVDFDSIRGLIDHGLIAPAEFGYALTDAGRSALVESEGAA